MTQRTRKIGLVTLVVVGCTILILIGRDVNCRWKRNERRERILADPTSIMLIGACPLDHMLEPLDAIRCAAYSTNEGDADRMKERADACRRAGCEPVDPHRRSYMGRDVWTRVDCRPESRAVREGIPG